MILTKQVENEAILSNVGATTDFKIKATAKSFRILADGLYANKIRAIVRELSCNAYDSHVAAGKTETPFDVHLPNSLEPFFSIRDYGVGLSDQEVTNIFTTFFESTKTGSNDFVGALGLGSKSPFSYTDSFTVTAIKNGIKGVYTAFINDHGVPSIALMAQEETTDPAGVEVRFAVENSYDFSNFCSEAVYVYRTFKHKPVVSGNSRFKFDDFDYETRDIIPGVHTANNMYDSIAIMGNIGYPIHVPHSNQTLGDLRQMLRCGLVMEFAIGELDFQASREGLSYIPMTVDAIKNKLEQLRDQLVVHVATEADKIENMWERAFFLMNKSSHDLWRAAVSQYVQNTNLDMFQTYNGYSLYARDITIKVDDLASLYNITVKAFDSDYRNRCSTLHPGSVHNDVTKNFDAAWVFTPHEHIYFVIQDTKTGAAERAKHHWRSKNTSQRVYVLAPADKTKAMDLIAFFAAIKNPPKSHIMFASLLDEKPRAAGMAKNVSIMHLERRGGRSNRSNSDDMVWRAAGKLSDFSKTETHYYLPIKGFESLGKVDNVKALTHYMERANIRVTVYGVRKADLETVKSMTNWVHLDIFVAKKLKEFGDEMVMGLVKSAIDFSDLYRHNVFTKVNSDSPYLKLYAEFKDVKKVEDRVQYAVEWLCKHYDVTTNTNIDVTATVSKYKKEVNELNKLYPLTQYLRYAPDQEVANYINMIDNFNNQKGE
jgi:hypothetical protein